MQEWLQPGSTGDDAPVSGTQQREVEPWRVPLLGERVTGIERTERRINILTLPVSRRLTPYDTLGV